MTIEPLPSALTRRHLLAGCAALAASSLHPGALAQAGARWDRRDGSAVQIAIGSGGHIWALGTQPVSGGFPVYRRDGNQWTRVPGGLVTLAVDAGGLPWGSNDQNRLYRHDGKTWQVLPGRGIGVTVGAKGTVFCLGLPPKAGNGADGGVFEWGGGDWTPIAGAAGVRIAADNEDLPWVVDLAGGIKRHDGGGWKSVPGKVSELSIGANGAVWAVGMDASNKGNSKIFRWDGRAWIPSDGSATRVAVAPNGMPWVLNDQGAIYQRV